MMPTIIKSFPNEVDYSQFNGEISRVAREDAKRIWDEINSMEFDPLDDISDLDVPGLGHDIIPMPLYSSTDDLVRESIERAIRNIQQTYSSYKKKLFLDDIRLPEHVSYYKPSESIYREKGWDIVANYEEFVEYINKNGSPDLISFDHDLADEHYEFEPSENNSYKEKTGYDCAKWLIEYCINKRIPLPQTLVHSQNPAGADKIKKALAEGKITLRSLFKSGSILRNYYEPLPSTIAEIKSRRMR